MSTSVTVTNVTVADTRFLVRQQGRGDGTPVLLLHGVPQTSSMWRDVATALATDRVVLAPDLPGLGGSAYSGPYDVPSVVSQLLALLDALVPDRQVDVVGHDWGGVLALALAGAHPDRVRRLAVVNAPYRQVHPVRSAHIGLFALPLVPELAFRALGARAVATMFGVGWKSRDVRLEPEVLAEYTAAYADPARVTSMLGYYRAAARPRVSAALRRTAPPALPPVHAEQMLVLWGAADPVLPVSVAESVVKDLGPSCVLVTVPGAGHFVVEEAPELVRDVLLGFLAPASVPATKAPVKRTPAKRAPEKRAPAKKAPTTPEHDPDAS